MRRIIIYTSLAATLAGCGGNYSNEDVDYQLALPERDDLAVKLPLQAQEIIDSAEYYKTTRDVVRVFNGIADAFLSLIDYVRSYPPSERLGARRVWGPFPNDKHPNWELRMVVDRVGDPGAPTRFEYSIEFRPVNLRLIGWRVLISGFFAPAGGVRRGTGQLKFLPAEARLREYPLDGLTGFDALVIDYDTRAFPISVKLTLDAFPSRERAVYEYFEEADGSGRMSFGFPTQPPLSPWVTYGMLNSRWKGSGAGRGDVTAVRGLVAAGQMGTDCWGIDTRATWVHRPWDANMNSGAESTCVFPAP
jgi:hypothetical protein